MKTIKFLIIFCVSIKTFLTTIYRLPRFKAEIKAMTKIPKLNFGIHGNKDEFDKEPIVNIAVFPMVKSFSLPCDLNISDRLKPKPSTPDVALIRTSNSFYFSKEN